MFLSSGIVRDSPFSVRARPIFDPRGGQWMKGRYVPSLLTAIAAVIEEHLIAIGPTRLGQTLAPRAGCVPSGPR